MTTIKVDIDHRRDYKKTKKWFNYRMKWVDYTLQGILPVKVVVFKTRKGFHFYAYTQKHLEPLELVVVQQCLGSDWLRELRNANRIITGMTTNWNIMFSEKFTETKTISKEKFVAIYILKPRLKK